MLFSILASPLLFLDTYSLSIFPLVFKASCIGINFLVLWSICPNSFFVHFNDSDVYSFKISGAEFGFQKFSRSSEVLFLSSPLVWMYPFVIFFFWKRSAFFLDLALLFLFICLFSLFIMSIAHFLMSNSWLLLGRQKSQGTSIQKNVCDSMYFY